MTTLVLGASGATGRLLVEQLLNQGETVRCIVRSLDSLPDSIKSNERLTIIEASLLDMTDTQLLEQVEGCDAVASCLGHNMTWKGVYGHPRRLVFDAVRRLCLAIEKAQPRSRVKFVLMNTTGNQNTQAGEKVSLGESVVMSLIRLLLPPHIDNEKAAAFLQSNIGSTHKFIEWVIVRPDSLIDESKASEYSLFSSPIRSAIFNAGKTSRVNVAHFMSRLILNDELWKQWRLQMPVIYNAEK
ncbi:NAD(P)-dependent oxidoreductase [Pleionea sp. CnH1-48]|uniref:NAD(P)-dependent oxidoreductase n=1 Tax=Pleionea sp. CnH1-48 TaxID=2954494 RepID=UPI002096A95E|nr:NAD(P)-binding oxidoreductase [Pleionea sp. CnH1-48]MCO7222704.1 SDR family oxidoreductase [Pleionea sp. CnH1-48]